MNTPHLILKTHSTNKEEKLKTLDLSRTKLQKNHPSESLKTRKTIL
jgi:hypothetical protein